MDLILFFVGWVPDLSVDLRRGIKISNLFGTLESLGTKKSRLSTLIIFVDRKHNTPFYSIYVFLKNFGV